MFSSLFAVLELGGRCAAWLSRSSSDLCSESSELSCQSIGLACVKPVLFVVFAATSMWLPGITIIVVSTQVNYL